MQQLASTSPSLKGVLLPTQKPLSTQVFLSLGLLLPISATAAPGEVSTTVFQVHNTALLLEYVLTEEL